MDTTPTSALRVARELRAVGLTVARLGREAWRLAVRDGIRQRGRSIPKTSRSDGLRPLATEIDARPWVARAPHDVEAAERAVATLDAHHEPERCPTCDGARYVLEREKQRGGHTMLDGLPPVMRQAVACPACNTPSPRDLVASSGIPDRYAGATFDTFPAAPEKQAAVAAVRAWCAAPVDLLLVGGNGRGKTGLAIAAVRALCERGIAARFVPVVVMLDRVRQTFDNAKGQPSEVVWAEYQRAPVLVLDDLGAPRVTEWVREQITALIEERRTANRPTVITSDVGADVLTEQYGPRLVSRLREYQRITVPGGDLRGSDTPR